MLQRAQRSGIRAAGIYLWAALLAGSLWMGCGAETPEPHLVIENGRVIVGDGPVMEEASVLVAEDSILSVTQEPIYAPGARRIDASGKTVLPGLIDAHIHLGGGGPPVDSTGVTRHFKENIPEVLKGFLTRGVTTVRSTGGFWPWEGQLRERLATGEIPGPRFVTAGPLLTTKGGHPATTVCSPDNTFCRTTLTRELTTPEQARAVVRALAEEGADFIKVVSDSVNHTVPIPLGDDVVKAIIDQAHREGLNVAGHVALGEDMMRYARMGMDGFVHPPTSPESRHHPRRLAPVLSRHNTPVTTTLSGRLFFGPVERALQGESPLRKEIERSSKHLSILAEAGVPIVAGTDWRPQSDHPALQPGAMLITELKMMRWGGMSRKAVLQAATANAARALEMSDKVGTLEEGKLADLIVVDGNPLEVLSALENMELVVQGGAVVAAPQ